MFFFLFEEEVCKGILNMKDTTNDHITFLCVTNKERTLWKLQICCQIIPSCFLFCLIKAENNHSTYDMKPWYQCALISTDLWTDHILMKLTNNVWKINFILASISQIVPSIHGTDNAICRTRNWSCTAEFT